MKDYKTKYEKAIEQAKKELQTCGSLDCDAARQIFRFFPELKKSEDERIKKEIIQFLQLSHPQFIGKRNQEKWIAWLEKQDPKKHEEELENAYKCADEVQYRKGYEDAKREFESQGEQKSQGKSALEIWKDMRLEVYQQASGNRHTPNYSDDSTKMFSLTNIDEIFEKVAEKQGEQKFVDKCKDCNNVKGCITCTDGDQYAHITEQKTTDNLEPKFKVGDWIVQEGVGTYKVVEVCKWYEVIGIDGNQYSISFLHENDCHLWTIQDAKDGDVLAINWKEVSQWQKIVIFKSLNEFGVEGYGNTFKNNKLAFKEDVPFYSKTWTKYLHPATKEQCDLLFSKMKEAGYEWDGEKKELKKIEQTYFQKQEWTGYDEKAYEIALLDIDKSHSITKNDTIDWLKSLKNRIQP